MSTWWSVSSWYGRSTLREGFPAARQPFPPPMTFKVNRSASAIKIDGVLDEEAWRGAVDVPVSWEWSCRLAHSRQSCSATGNVALLYGGEGGI